MKFKLLLFTSLCIVFQIQAQKPDLSRFTVKILASGLDEPMEMAFLPEGKVLIIERKGALKLFDDKTGEIETVAMIDCNTIYTNKEGKTREAEEGLMGIVADPNYSENHWIYLYYADPEKPEHLVTRWEFRDNELIESSRKVLLAIPAQREECCHTGGGMTFDTFGNLYVTVGNNTSNGNSAGYAPLDERPGREPWDDQRGAGNTNDLRGSVIRIKPKADGSYEIPKGNLFPEGTPKTRPEIYAKGARNPWRPVVDSKTNYLYWGEVGPDASVSSEMGPKGYDEFNQAKKAGFFGWPYFAGNNEPYADFDFESKQRGEFFSIEKPINDSPNNTGLRELPSPAPAFIWYPYDISDKFPLLGVSGRSATGVAIFRKGDFKNPERPFPDYYEGKLFIGDLMRGWIMAVTMDENSDYESMERFMPEENFSSLIDMQFGPSGDLYVLKYGSAWFGKAENSALQRIEYIKGNRPPVAKLKVNRTNGKIPLEIQASAEDSYDPDANDIIYKWSLVNGKKIVSSATNEMTTFTISKAGEYRLVLQITDANGASTNQEILIKAGNTSPKIDFDLKKSNSTFYFEGKEVNYEVLVEDEEDGSLDFTEILPSEVSVNIDYKPESFDPVEISAAYATEDARSRFNTGFKLISKNDCGSCHLPQDKSIGPSYLQVANKYQREPGAKEKLAQKVIAGGEGVWGDHAMAAHPQLSTAEAEAMVAYILDFAKPLIKNEKAGISGKIITNVPEDETGFGGYVLRAAYTDRGAKKVSPIFSEKIVLLKYPFLDPREADIKKNTENIDTPTKILQFFGPDSYIGFKDIDLTGISKMQLLLQASKRTSSAGGFLEIRLDAPDGELIGKSEFIDQYDGNFEKLELTEDLKKMKIRQEQLYRQSQQAAEYFNGQTRVFELSLKETEGVHDLYFVPVGPAANPKQNVFSFSGVEFIPK